MRIDFYKSEDRKAIEALAVAQSSRNLYLPFPEDDMSVCVALVGREGERIVCAGIGTLSIEAHLAIAPDEPGAVHKIQRLFDRATGVVQAESRRMRQLGMPGIVETRAFIAEDMPQMARLVRLLGFKEDAKGERVYAKPIWE